MSGEGKGSNHGNGKAHCATVAKARREAQGSLNAEVGLDGLDEVVEKGHVLSALVAPETG